MIEIKQTQGEAKKKRRKQKKIAGLFWKALIVAIEIHGMSCVTMSYVLAFMYHDQVVETVSATIVTEIIAPAIAGILSKTLENIFEKNELSFSKPIQTPVSKEEDEPKEEEESVG